MVTLFSENGLMPRQEGGEATPALEESPLDAGPPVGIPRQQLELRHRCGHWQGIGTHQILAMIVQEMVAGGMEADEMV